MAIVFTKDLLNTKLYTAYNNNIIDFYSDETSPAVKVTITIVLNVITLYPSPSGLFNYNFKELITTILNTDNFADDLEIDIDTNFVYDWTDKVSLNQNIVFEITKQDATLISVTKDITWLSAYVNLRDYKRTYPSQELLVNDIAVLQKTSVDNYYKYKVTYWLGYPFGLTLWLNSQDLTITNETNLVDYTFTGNDKVDRLIFSDGRSDFSIANIIPLADGFNNLNFNDIFNLELHTPYTQCSDGVYLKYINSFGGWSYWLFNKGNEDTKTKDKGSLFNDYNNLEDTTSPLISLGKESSNTIQVQERNVNEDFKNQLTDLIDSPKVYLFTGLRFSKNTFNDWMEVVINDGSFRIENSRTNLYTFNFKIELPPNVTRTL